MTTYQIDVTTEDGTATIYTDNLAEFARSFFTRVIGVETRAHAQTNLLGQPKLVGYHGPFDGGTTATGEPVIRYADRGAHPATSH